MPSDDGNDADGGGNDDDKPKVMSEEWLAASQLVDYVREAFELDEYLTRSELASGGWLFYVVVGELAEQEEPIGFVRQYNPQRGIKAGRLLAAYQDTLMRFDQPLFNFDFDVVIAPDEIAVLKTTGFERVFSDLAVAVANVPTHVTAIGTNLAVDLSTGSSNVLKEICEERPRYAKRIQRLAGAAYLPSVTAESFRAKLAQHGLDENLLGSEETLELETRDDVGLFLDMLEQRYYESDFTEEHRRAGRYSSLS